MSVTYLHHRAFELEDLILGTTKLIEWLDQRPQVKEISFDQDDRTATTLGSPPTSPMSLDMKEVRAYGTPAVKMTPSEKLALEYDMRKARQYLDLWFRSFRLFVERHPTTSERLASFVEDMRSMTSTRSMLRFSNRLTTMQELFPTIQSNGGRSAPVTIARVEDVIIVKQEDFEYPFGASWLEFMLKMKNLGLGKARLDHMIQVMIAKGGSNQIGTLHDTIQKRFIKDIGEKLIPAMNGVDERMERQIYVQRSFIESLANVMTDFIITMAIQYFNFGVGFTDMAQGTTIQFRAIKTILLQIPSMHTPALTERQMQFIGDVIPHFIRHSTGK